MTPSNPYAELKPCPFCGARPFEYDMLDEYGGKIVECEDCACRTSIHEDRGAARETWNTRADDPTLSQLTRDVEEARIDCEFLLSVIDSCDEAEAPSCEMEPEDVANIARIRAILTRLAGEEE